MTSPFWLDEPYSPRPPLEGDATADVAVLGGGITGVSAAYALASRGCKVALVERGAVASGATGRNAGFVLAGVAHTYSIAIKAHGPERAKRLWQLSLENHGLIRERVEAEKINCLYARNGSYTLALSDNEFEALNRTAKAAERDGIRAELLDDTEVARIFPRAGFKGGTFNPDDGEIHPARFVRGLARAAESRGARVYEGTRITGIETSGAIRLATDKGNLSAAMLLLATNAYTALLHPYFEDTVVGMRAQMIATEPCPQRLIPAPVYADYGFEYFRQLPDGRILAGGGRRAALDAELTYADQPSDPVQNAIESFLRSCIPRAADLKITHRWGGTMGFSCDELPNVGPVPGSVNTYVAAGFHGHGLGFGVLSGESAAQMMLDGKSTRDLTLFSPRRHLPE